MGERGQDSWQEISYEQALDEIAERLQGIVDRFGPEALAVSTSGWNTQTTHSMDRRFMNLLGSPNWISGVELCGQYRCGEPSDLWLVPATRFRQHPMYCVVWP